MTRHFSITAHSREGRLLHKPSVSQTAVVGINRIRDRDGKRRLSGFSLFQLLQRRSVFPGLAPFDVMLSEGLLVCTLGETI